MSDTRRRLLAIAAALLTAGVSPAWATETVIDDATVVRVALEKNPTLAASVTELRRADLLEEAEAERYPLTLVLDGKATRNAAPNLGPGRVNFPTSTLYTAGGELRKKLPWGTDLTLRLEAFRQESISLFSFAQPGQSPQQVLFRLGPGYGSSLRFGVTQPLLRGAGRSIVEAQLDQARAGRTNAKLARDRTASQTLAEALTAYWELYYASRAVDIQEHTLSLARQQRDEAAARVKTGGLAPVEVLTFESRIAQLEEDLVTARAEERRKSAALGRVLGDPTLEQRRAAEREPPHHPEPGADARRHALSESPEIAEQRSAVELAEVTARSASDSLRSRLDLDGYVQAHGLGYDDASAFGQVGTLRALSAQVGLTYEAPLDNTRHRSERARAELAVVTAKQKLDATTQKVLADLDDATQRDTSARQRIELADRTLELARQQRDAEQARFRTGAATALQVRESEDQVRSAELRAVRARVDLATAHVTIAHLTGSLVAETARSTKP